MNKFLLLLSTCFFLPACMRNGVSQQYEYMDLPTKQIYIKQRKFDSLTKLWLYRPYDFGDTIEVLQIIRIANTLEFPLITNNMGWKVIFRRRDQYLYKAFLHRYYTEFHQVAYKYKDFLHSNDSLKQYCKNVMQSETAYRADNAKLVAKKRYKKTILYYKTKRILLLGINNQLSDHYVVIE